MSKAIILDRDGVINLDSPNFIRTAEDFIPIAGSIEAIAKLSALNYKVVICTNQSGIARGLFSLNDLKQIHQKMIDLVKNASGTIAAIYFCPHAPEANCYCRKPKIGMILKIKKQFAIEKMKKTFMVGDSLRDLLTIYHSGGIPILVKTGNGMKTLRDNLFPKNTLIFTNLFEVAKFLEQKHLAQNEKK